MQFCFVVALEDPVYMEEFLGDLHAQPKRYYWKQYVTDIERLVRDCDHARVVFESADARKLWAERKTRLLNGMWSVFNYVRQKEVQDISRSVPSLEQSEVLAYIKNVLGDLPAPNIPAEIEDEEDATVSSTTN